MRWFLSLLLAVMLPLQSAWALAVPVCTQHQGPADHAMQGPQAEAGHCHDAAPDDASTPDRECHSACHHFSAVLSQPPVVTGVAPAAPDAAPLPPASPAPLAPRPERPQWAPLA